MRDFVAKTVQIDGPCSAESVQRAAGELREALGRPARLAFAFVSPDYVPHLADFCETLRVDGHVIDVVGCTATGRIAGSQEIEEGSGCSILALSCDAGEPVTLTSGQPAENLPRAVPNAWIALVNPQAADPFEWLSEWNADYPRVPCVGGLATAPTADELAVFHNGRLVDAVVVPVTGETTIVPIVSQGCRPIGEPLTVTKAEQNVVYALGGQPAYSALEHAFQTLSDDEKSNARGNLFAGIAGNEYVDEFKSGDFLIRNIIGADPNSGAVVIGDIPRIGQTLQYQLRDREAASQDLSRAVLAADLVGRRPFAALLFSCLGRGKGFFREPDHDARVIQSAARQSPLAGFFCGGEIGPVGGKNAIHSHTAAAALWVEKRDC